MMPNEEILKKVIGDPTDEAPEAAYRLAATAFVGLGRPLVIEALGRDERVKTFLKDYPQLSEIIVSFVLAVVVEFLPMPSLDDERKRLAYNLRVRTYEEFGEGVWKIAGDHLLPIIPELARHAYRSIRMAKGELVDFFEEVERDMPGARDLKPDVPAKPNAREVAGGRRRSE